MKVIDITGGIGSGKSTVTAMIRDLGIPVIDADEISRKLSQKGGRVWQAIFDCFGPDYFLPDGTLDRKALANLVFADGDKREMLNRITHPLIKQEVLERIGEIREKGLDRIVFVDVPLLFESGWDEMVDETWVVTVPESIQIERLIKRDGYTMSQAMQRIKSQMSLEEKCRRADIVIDNSLSLEHTREQVLRQLDQKVQEDR